MLRLEQWEYVQELARQGLSYSAIQRETGFDWRTVKKYAAGPPPPTPAKRKTSKATKLAPYEDHIRARLARYPQLTAVRLYEEIQELGYPGKETQVKTFVRAIRPPKEPLAVWRFETPPGLQAQVDWAHVGYVREDGKRRKAYAFQMILGYSRFRFVKFTTRTDTASLIRLHLEAFEFFGGFPKTVLYDNMFTVVLERGPDAQHRRWNELFQDFSTTLGFRPHLCAPYRAQTKGKVENGIKFLRMGFLVGREFVTIDEMNVAVQPWLHKVNFERVHDTTGKIPTELHAEENLTLLDPTRPYVITQRYPRKVARDAMVSFQNNEYSVPWRFANQKATAGLTGKILTIEVGGEVVARHEVRSGTMQRVRVKEHFDGLLQAIRSKNRESEEWRAARHAFELVAQRPLEEYDVLLGEVGQ